MATSYGGYIQNDQTAPPTPSLLPPWLASSTTIRPQSPSVTLSLSPSIIPPTPTITRLHPDNTNPSHYPTNLPSLGIAPMTGDNALVSEIVECGRELEENHRAWTMHRKEAAWRLKRVELQLESEKACRRREKMEDIEAKINALREEQKASLDRIEAEYREQLAGLRTEAEMKEQKLAEQWALKHLHLSKFLEQMGCRSIAD
ncbi:hypothetical protein DH2020_017789 [Rehmannia glutinosa]|uniref:Transcription factor AS1-like n=1 Tax=Rehmannia glutinosa TaxID=99300 RepID=A0ABR0WKM8_REHGL